MLHATRRVSLIVAIFLVSCQANAISLAEATEVRNAIRTYTQSEAYTPPQRFTLIDASEYNGVTLELKEIYDAENHFDYRRTRWTKSGETTENEMWVFFDGVKTYTLISEANGLKIRTEDDGNTFGTERSYDNSWLENWNEIDWYAEKLNSVTEENVRSKNVYQSKGEGHLYYKLYLPLEGGGLETMELLFDHYNLVHYSTESAEASEDYTVDYQNVSISHPDIFDFQLTSETA